MHVDSQTLPPCHQSGDTVDAEFHFTPANLVNKFHRFDRTWNHRGHFTSHVKDDKHFAHHAALPSCGSPLVWRRRKTIRVFATNYGEQGHWIFVYDGRAFKQQRVSPANSLLVTPLEASQAVARRHGLLSGQVVYAQQNQLLLTPVYSITTFIAVGIVMQHFYHQEAF